jgi:signal transduction histidine kinase
MQIRKYIVVMVLFVTVFSVVALAENADKVYKVGAVYLGDKEEWFTKTFTARMRYLTKHVRGASFEIVPIQLGKINYAVENKLIDFLYVESLKYIELEALYGVERLVTAEVTMEGVSSSKIAMAIFVNAERDDIDRLKDLRGKRLVIHSKLSTDSWHVLLREFKWAGIDPDKDFVRIKRVPDRVDVFNAVRDGLADAGAVWEGYMEIMASTGKVEDINDYRVIPLAKELDTDVYKNHSTRFYPRRTFAKLSHVPSDIAKKVTISLMSWKWVSGNKGKRASSWTVPADYREVHEMAKELGLPPYTDHGVIRFADVLKKYHRWIIAFSIIVVLMAFAIVFIIRLNRKLASTHKNLKTQISERVRVEHELQESHDNLEDRVERRRAEIGRQHSLLRSLRSKLSQGEEQMRRQFAVDIHDNISQNLAMSKMKLSSLGEFSSSQKLADNIREINDLLSSAIEVTRTMTFELSPPVLYELGLIAALKWLAMQTSRQHDLCVQLKDDNLQLHIDDDIGSLVFRATQELLVNVAKHAKAKKVIISAQKIDGMLNVTVTDDGIGFDTEVAGESGFGLFNIRERLDYIGGELEIISELGKGTSVSLQLPVNGDSEV